jgi:hypothetical protein
VSSAKRTPWRARALGLWRSPLGKVLAVALLLRLAGFSWGLPSYDGWDNDGVAPRDFLVGVLETYTPGHHFTYPPLHLLLLTVAAAPVWVTTILRAPALTPAAVIPTFIGVPTMTAMAVVARGVAVALSLGLLWNLGAIGALLRGPERAPRAAAWVAAACGLNAVLTYYSQTTNLDLPYLFWSVLALRWLMQAIVRHEPRALRKVVVFAALGVATKDQAYALFILGTPLALAAWLLLDAKARADWRAIARELAVGVAVGLPLLLLIDGAVTNPSGFRDRVRYLLGPASQDFAYYPPTWSGRLRVATDALLTFDQFYPWGFALLALAGLVVACRVPDRARRAAGLVPLLAALSFIVAFDMSARRSEHRFALPQMVLFGVYAGLALDAFDVRVASARSAWSRWAARASVAVVLSYGLFKCAAVDVAMLLDPRYDAERWLAERLRPGDRVEVYGSNVQLPRMPANAVIHRVDLDSVAGRNPILGVTEVTDRFSNVEARRPRFIIVPAVWAIRWVVEPTWGLSSGRVLSPGQARLEGDTDSRDYFRALFTGRLAYDLAHASIWKSTFWPAVDVHASLTREVWLFERKGD